MPRSSTASQVIHGACWGTFSRCHLVEGVVAVQKRLEQAGVRYRLHPITFLTRSLVAGMPSPSTLPTRSAEAKRLWRPGRSNGSTRTFVPLARPASGGSLTTPFSMVPGVTHDLKINRCLLKSKLFLKRKSRCGEGMLHANDTDKCFPAKARRRRRRQRHRNNIRRA